MIRAIGTGGGTGHVIEYYGPAISALSMEGRMTICNMSIEAGARAGLIAPDDTTFDYIAKAIGPSHPGDETWKTAIADWKTLRTEDPIGFRQLMCKFDASALVPQVTWGTNPAMTVDVTGRVPDLAEVPAPAREEDAQRLLTTWA